MTMVVYSSFSTASFLWINATSNAMDSECAVIFVVDGMIVRTVKG
jgi:hypothetical protein